MSFEALDNFCGEPFWDYNLTWNTTNPDLTMCLQQTLLTWIPCGLLWILTPLEFYLQKVSVAKRVPWTGTNVTRMTVAASLAILCFADLMDIAFNRRFEKMFTANIVAALIKSATFILSVILMALNKKRGRHTSGVLFIFWLCLTICEIFAYRSAFIQIKTRVDVPDKSTFVFKMVYFPLLVAELFISCFADIRQRPISYFAASHHEEKECPELSASFLSKLVFWWFNDMAILGYKKPLVIDDLWDLNPEDRTEFVAGKFEKYWRGKKSETLSTFVAEQDNGHKPNSWHEVPPLSKEKNEPKSVHIVRSLCKTFWPYFSLGTICKFLYDCLQFVNPLILKMLIDYVQTSEPLWKGVMYSLLFLANGCIQSVLLGDYFQRMFVLGMRVRTALVSAIYHKSLVLSSMARRTATTGEIVNLMSVDSQRFMDLMTYLNLVWSAPFQILIAVIMLWKILGPSVLAGLFVMILLIPTNAVIANRVKNRQVKQMKSKDERVKLVNEVLSGIKVLKLYAWEEAFKEKILNIRNKEVKDLKRISYLSSYGLLIWTCSPFLVALASFASFVLSDEKNVLDATTAFVSLSLFNILRFPLTMLPNMITTLVLTSVSVKRINKYLNSEELEEYVLRSYEQDHDDVVIKNGDFSWARGEGETEKLTLKDINLNVRRGSLVAIVGQVGSGKSSLLSAVLGDMEKIRGSVYVNGTVAYVSQQPWIQNASLRDNILFLQPFHKDSYQDTLEACGLLPDLLVLPGGDSTEIGEKGINLSGGQKQRVSLARAVYSLADIYLLDDPLSAVDSHVGRHIFDKVIGPKGLLHEKTRLLVTHGLTYLPQTDVIFVMKDGVVAEMGSYQQLLDSKGPFSEFLSQYLLEADLTEENLELLEDIGHKNPELLRSLSSESDGRSDSDVRRGSLLSVNRLPRSPSIQRETSIQKEKSASIEKKEKPDYKLIQTEIAETGKVHWGIYISYLKAVGLKWSLGILLAYISWQIFSVYSNVWLSEWGNDPVHANRTKDIYQRNLRLSVYGALGFGQGIAVFVGSFGIAYGTLKASNSLHEGLLVNVLRSPMAFFDTTPLGRIVNRFAKDIDTVDVTIPMTLRSWLSCLLQVVATVIVVSVQTPIFLAVFLPIGVLYYFIQRFYVSTSRQLKRLESITRSPIYSHFSETLAGCSTIRAYSAQESFRKQSSNLVDKNQICYYPSVVANRWLAIRLDICGNCIIFSSALFAVLGRESLDPGKVGLSISYALMVTATLNWLVRMNSELETNIVAVERIFEYTTTPTEAPWVLSDVQLPEGWPQDGNVQLKDYSTRYREGLDLVLKGINCNFTSGEKVGIVGRTGAGKSSLTLSLFRIIEAAGGSIVIDGVPISSIGLHQLRSKITIIPQDPVLFSGTLRMNLDPFSWYSDAHLWEALAHAHLKDFVSSLDNGLSHEIVEGGENLSVGQRQLVCLARALLRKTKILVLDEATAAVDLETDDLIQATIRREFADCTVLTIAHRLNTVMDYDRVMVLSDGHIEEFDSPDVLMKNRKSSFYAMAKDAGLV